MVDDGTDQDNRYASNLIFPRRGRPLCVNRNFPRFSPLKSASSAVSMTGKREPEEADQFSLHDHRSKRGVGRGS